MFNTVGSNASDRNSGMFNPYKVDLSPVDHAEGNVPSLIQDYKERMREFNEQLRIKNKKENTETIQERLARIDIGNINKKDRLALEYLVGNSFKLKQFATHNDYDMKNIDFTALENAVKAANLRLEKLRTNTENTEVSTNYDESAYSTNSTRSLIA